MYMYALQYTYYLYQLFRPHTLYDTVSDVVESRVHQCQQNSDAKQDGLIFPQEISFEAFDV